jgi:hypothetical protein
LPKEQRRGGRNLEIILKIRLSRILKGLVIEIMFCRQIVMKMRGMDHETRQNIVTDAQHKLILFFA